MVRRGVRSIVFKNSYSRGPPMLDSAKRSQFTLQPSFISERKLLRVRLQEEIERIDHGHLRDQIHFDAEVLDALGEHHASQESCFAGPAAN